ncbi:DUF6945 domain-containing protein [Kluyvera intermedia]|uniref:DUF6945 domain-containing protein n=1 Tax=Enterobacteriaceae TaxID=543 RepID=UPI000A69C5BC|nr:ArsR family transcriptional regulator [Kluyvera intermedia]WQD30529.1 ArsR family transcriptional regulator [Kluyvera intermedia]VDZ86522.1 Uncharacterised protein [Kluyvera intermedia]
MTDIINGDIYKYFGTEEALSEASHITNVNTGERVELSNNTKALYARMRKRFHFFTTSNIGGNKGIYHDNVEELAASVGISKRTALRCLEDLKQVGLVIANLSGRSNQWIVTDLTPDAFRLERRTGTTADPVWIDCLKNPVFGNVKEDVAQGVQEEKQQPVPEEAKADPKPEKPKQIPTKKLASIPAKEIKIEAVNPVSIGLYRDEWENPEKNLPVSQHPKIRWLLINGYLDTEKNPKLKTIYEEIKHLC